MTIRNAITYLSLSILLTIYSGCNKDEAPSTPDPVNNVPGNFEITISDVSHESAIVNWTVPTTDEPTTLVYSIYLNESLLAENLSDVTYELTDLNGTTNYSMKVEATNEYGSSTSSKEFITLEPPILRLISYDQGNYNFILEYDELGLLTYRGDPSPYGYTNIDFTYNQNNNILTEYSRYYDASATPSGRLNYHYLNNTMESLSILERGEDYRTEYEFQFEQPTNYSYETTSTVYVNGQTEVYYSNYTVELELDNDGRVIKFTRTNIETFHIDRVYFEYLNDNLTKITNGSDVLEMTYDNANNWHTYRSGFLPYFYNHGARDLGGLIYFPNIVRWLNQIPQFYDYVNKNNPQEYKLNGEVFTSFQYEYNSSNYPSKITIPQNNVTIDLEYEAIEREL